MKSLVLSSTVPSGEAALSVVRDPNNVVSVLPGVVSIQGNRVRLKFKRFLLSHDSTYEVSLFTHGSRIVEYKLEDQRGNTLKIMFSLSDNELSISVSYSGEREWVMKPALEAIIEQIGEGLRKEMERKSAPTSGDYSQLISKLSSLTKIIMKSKIVKSEVINLKEGELIDYLHQIIIEFQHYPVIYVSGTGDATFRLLLVNGEVKGVYVLKDGKEHLGEDLLNLLNGDYKVHVYVSLNPKVLEVGT
ncbi:hypothetical protein [Metallosphaera hakonensis]|uniref:Uncharacterized protein n=1 Tax=Metallosphaera hakonensis JCM 8857 = DSM 7519 TaxID=1293036 RepID=A0A2U9IRI3_9CREN|nr:hypothetical protein [Metallosphaera hakonensis]AWR98583.1 hypothetical protein DFR87_01430 [Metallosphaera hakonensis JCM 8857 = DSM 7519]